MGSLRCMEDDHHGCTHTQASPATVLDVTLRLDIEDIRDNEVIGDASIEGVLLLRSRFIQLIHRLQRTQEIHVRHALLFGIFV